MKKEPKQRRDGMCALRTCRKPLPAPAVKHSDPFHTSICCRMFHGVKFGSDEASFKYHAQARAPRTLTEKQRRGVGAGLKIRKGK